MAQTTDAMTDVMYVGSVKAGEIIDATAPTLKRWRRQGIGPKYIRIETGRVRYRVSDLKDWLDAQQFAPQRD